MPLTAPFEPVEVTDVQMAFPADALDRMPEEDDIPEEWFNRSWQERLWFDVFHHGLEAISLTPAPDVDPEKAWRHIQSIIGSFAPRHEHKMASAAYLTSLWFKGARWKPTGSDEWSEGGVVPEHHPDELEIKK